MQQKYDIKTSVQIEFGIYLYQYSRIMVSFLYCKNVHVGEMVSDKDIDIEILLTRPMSSIKQFQYIYLIQRFNIHLTFLIWKKFTIISIFCIIQFPQVPQSDLLVCYLRKVSLMFRIDSNDSCLV